jgi:hypothetical protein
MSTVYNVRGFTRTLKSSKIIALYTLMQSADQVRFGEQSISSRSGSRFDITVWVLTVTCR